MNAFLKANAKQGLK